MYDFPSSPTPGQEYTPPVGGQTYIWQPPRWLVKGIPPVGGSGSGGGIPEAPIDSQQYAREDADWTVVEPGVSDWADITGKPATFPPTVPIPWTDVSGKPATFPPTLPIDYTAGISGKPATFPPTLPIAQSGVTNLTTDLGLKAPLASPALTGTPTAPTPTMADNTTKLATTEFVKGQNYAALASPTFTGDPKAPTPAVGDNDTSLATTEFVKAQGYAPLASPAFTGNPTAPTPSAADNDTSVATTAYVKAQGYATTAQANTDYVNVTGDTMTGALTVQADITTTSVAGFGDILAAGNITASSSFVAAQSIFKGLETTLNIGTTGVGTINLRASGFGSTTGQSQVTPTGITLPGDPTTALQAATKQYVDSKAGAAIASVSDAAPSSPANGQLWFDSSLGTLYIYYNDGTSSQWVQVVGSG
jgi:hypothetical protein